MIVYHKFTKLHVFLTAPQTSCEHPAQATSHTGMIRIIPATSSSWPLLSVTSWHSSAPMKSSCALCCVLYPDSQGRLFSQAGIFFFSLSVPCLLEWACSLETPSIYRPVWYTSVRPSSRKWGYKKSISCHISLQGVILCLYHTCLQKYPFFNIVIIPITQISDAESGHWIFSPAELRTQLSNILVLGYIRAHFHHHFTGKEVRVVWLSLDLVMVDLEI